MTSWTLGGTPGVNTLTASAPGASPVVFNANAVTGAASELTSLITTSIDTILAGAVAAITLQSKDASSNDLTVGGFTVEFTTVGGTSTGVLSPTTDNGDGTYTATFSGQLAGTATTISATINGATVTTTLPTITVLPGAVSTVTSLVTTSVGNLVAGTNAILKLDTKDAFGNDIPSGGHAVVFNIAGGSSTGTISATTDVGDGTYTATLTGQLAGTPVTVGATINGVVVTSTLPTLTVIPGAVSTATSLVTSSVATLVAGSNAVLTLVAKDALGNNLTTGGHSVVFSIAGGTSTGTVGATVDNGDGTYSSTLTGQLVGTAVTVNATINGNAVSSTLPSVTVIPGVASPLTSLLTISTDTIAADGLVSLGLDTKDAFGNDVTVGGHAVVFTASGGTSTGSISATADNGDGTYSATFAGLLAGTATTIGATLDGQVIATALPTVTVIPGLPVNIAINAGEGQLALVGTVVTIAPSVIVTDNQGNPVANVAVTFSVTAGLGLVLPVTPVLTGVDGIAAATAWTLGALPGVNTLTATAAGVPGSAVFTANGTSSAPITLEEVVAASDSFPTLTLPSIGGGTNQTYVMFSTSLASGDVVDVSGGGLVWTEQIEQCAGTQDTWSRIWTAQGTVGAPFQLAVLMDSIAGSAKSAVVLARYSNVASFEGVAGNSNNGGSPCTGASTFSSPATLSLTSTAANSVHLVGVSLKAETITDFSTGYSELGNAIGYLDNTKMFVYGRSFSSATTDIFNATLLTPRRWATSGIVLRPN